MRESFTLPGLDDLLDHPGPEVDGQGQGKERDPTPLSLTRTRWQALRWYLGSPTNIAAAAAAVVLIAVGALALWTPSAPRSATDTDPAPRGSAGSSAFASAGVAPMSTPSIAGQPLAGSAITVRVTEYVTVTVTSAPESPVTGASNPHPSPGPGTVPPTTLGSSR